MQKVIPPIISTFQERRSKLSQECTRNLLCCFLWVLKNVEQQVIRSWWLDSNTQKLILDVLYLCQLNFEYKVKVLSSYVYFVYREVSFNRLSTILV